MSIVCFSLGFLCILYFIVILFYSGLGTSFCGLWPVLSVLFVLMGFFLARQKKNRDAMPKRLPCFIASTFALAAATAAALFLFIIGESFSEPVHGCDYVIVPGARVYDDGISLTLKKRLDRAMEYAAENPDTVFVLSGGTEDGQKIPEALAMYNYMAMRGMDTSRLLIEPRSVSTAENMRYSTEVIRNDMQKRMVPPPLMIGVCSSDYHLYRIRRITEKITEEPVFGIPAPSDALLYVHMCARECCAIMKDRLTGDL